MTAREHDESHFIGPIKVCRCPCSVCLAARFVVWNIDLSLGTEESIATLAALEAAYDAGVR